MSTTPAHEPATATCAASTASGAQCRRKAKPGTKFCAQHTAGAARTAKGKPAAKSKATAAPKSRPAAKATKDARTASASSESSSTRTKRDGPDGIDSAAYRDVLRDLKSAGSFNFGYGPTSALEDAANVFKFFTSNISRVRDMAMDSGLVDGHAFERFLGDVANALTSLTAGMAERLSGQYDEDDFGFDAHFTESMVPLISLLYDWYWRVETHGIENVPAAGRGLIVSNHAGAGLPFDGAMIKLAVFREAQNPRHLRMLVLDWLMGLPWLADLMKKTGQVLACSPNASELLMRDELVAVFPEGIKGMSKPFSQRYNLERFGRGGFVRVALKTGSPIIPVAVVGSEEIYPKIGNVPFANKLIGAPFIPMTPFFPFFGLAGLIPLPSKWHIEFCEPIDVTQYPPEAADDRAFVLELSERIRATIQERIHENLLRRQTPFW